MRGSRPAPEPLEPLAQRGPASALQALLGAVFDDAVLAEQRRNGVEIHRVELLPPFRERNHLNDLLNKSADRDEERSESREMDR